MQVKKEEVHYLKGRTTQNEKKGKTNLWNIAEYEHALNIIIGAGMGSRTG